MIPPDKVPLEMGMQFFNARQWDYHAGSYLLCVVVQVTHEVVKWKSVRCRSPRGSFPRSELLRHVHSLSPTIAFPLD